MKVIGLIGKKGSGKDTVAELINEFKPMKRVTYADKLKNVCSSVFSVPLNKFNDRALKESQFNLPVQITLEQMYDLVSKYNLDVKKNLLRTHVGIILNNPREVLQYVGTNVLRSIDEDIHVKQVQFTEDSIISDVRFQNEIDHVKNNEEIEYHSVFISRNTERTDLHASEDVVSLQEGTYILDNNGDLNELKKNVKKMLTDIGILAKIKSKKSTKKVEKKVEKSTDEKDS